MYLHACFYNGRNLRMYILKGNCCTQRTLLQDLYFLSEVGGPSHGVIGWDLVGVMVKD